jgi:hypothetical protein
LSHDAAGPIGPKEVAAPHGFPPVDVNINPFFEQKRAAVEPAGPAPTMMTSYFKTIPRDNIDDNFICNDINICILERIQVNSKY